MHRFSPEPKVKLGLLGGTFDPIHHGHLILAEWLLSELQLDRVVFIPLFQHAFRTKRCISSAHHRLAMVRLAVKPFAGFEVSDFEISRARISYTIDTLQHFKRTDPAAALYFFIGGDNLAEFHRWKDYQKLLELATFVVYDRPGGRLPEHLPKEKFVFVKAPLIEISSTLIRQRIKEQKPVQSLLPLSVWAYIQENKLYL